MHPVTRLGRVIQQLRSFGSLHANELEGMAQELDVAGAAELAVRLRAYRDVQRDEAQMVVDELVDIQTEMANSALPVETLPAAADPHDPAANSPRRAKWLAEQAAEAERLRQPVSRRDLLSGGVPKEGQ
jgi:metal-dependent amidase/aminoacylase/carboxypeptidase family protein